MNQYCKDVLNNLSHEHLVFLIERLMRSLYLISGVCVEESKWHIDASKALDQIRHLIYIPPLHRELSYLQSHIDAKIQEHLSGNGLGD